MATSDLQNELLKDKFQVDDFSERKLCKAILEQLEDVSGDISALAVKWCVRVEGSKHRHSHKDQLSEGHR